MTAEEKALEFFNESYSGSDASGFIKPYVINAFKAGSSIKDREIAELNIKITALKSIIFNEKAKDKEFVAAVLEEVEKGKALLNELISDHNKEVAELKSRCFTLERFRIEDAASAINEANQLRETIKELKAEIERLKGEAESRVKDAWERACHEVIKQSTRSVYSTLVNKGKMKSLSEVAMEVKNNYQP